MFSEELTINRSTTRWRFLAPIHRTFSVETIIHFSTTRWRPTVVQMMSSSRNCHSLTSWTYVGYTPSLAKTTSSAATGPSNSFEVSILTCSTSWTTSYGKTDSFTSPSAAAAAAEISWLLSQSHVRVMVYTANIRNPCFRSVRHKTQSAISTASSIQTCVSDGDDDSCCTWLVDTVAYCRT